MLMKLSDEVRKLRTFAVPCEHGVERILVVSIL